jgi:uncharacterized membrane protein
MKDIITFAITMLILDLVFIKFIIGPAYKKFIPGFDVKMVFAVLAYATMIASWYLIKGSVAKAALTGFVIYGTYAFTVAAVFPGYPITLGLTEIAWGTSLFAICTFVSNYLGTI